MFLQNCVIMFNMKKILLCLCLLLCSCSNNNRLYKKLYDLMWNIDIETSNLVLNETRYVENKDTGLWEIEILSTYEFVNYDVIKVVYDLDKHSNIAYIYTSGYARLLYK